MQLGYTLFMTPQIGEIWQHYKTKGEYEIVDLGKLQVKVDELDMKECVVYKSLEDNNVWVRPLADFVEIVKNEEGNDVTRFSKVR
jgi:hypothetical protein